MTTRVDEKGKVFTERVRKDMVRATVYTPSCTIKGYIYVQPDLRLRDELNVGSERFIAISDVEVCDSGGSCVLESAPFLILNKDHIIAIVPNEGQPPKTETSA